MLPGFKTVRHDERRDVYAAFALLFGLIGSHTVLETARDALFLARVPATRLPLVYIAIAVVSLVVAEAQARLGRRLPRRTALTVWTGLAAAVTLAFWTAAGSASVAALYGLYIWSGVLTTLVLVHFWTLLGEMFSITQAKRLYGVVGTGSVLGAIVGSAVAGALTQVLAARDLLLVAAGGLLLTSLVPMFLRDMRRAATTEESRDANAAVGMLESARFIGRQPYARRIVALTILAAIGVTLADYLFKSTAAAQVAPDELARFFALVYLALNAASLLVQIALVGPIIRRLNVTTAIAVLPFGLLLGGIGMVAAVGLPAALALKGADGALKHSLHRTASELLFVPLSAGARASVKAFGEVVGQRGGQSLASLAILALVAVAAPPRVLAIVLVAIAAAWLLVAVTTRRHYLQLFRGRIEAGRIVHLDEFPELNVASLETLIATLDGDHDGQVIAAMEALEREGKARLVPALILYHPSQSVVEHALRLFARARRDNAVHVIDRILEHDNPAIRIAAVATRSVLAPDEQLLRMRLSAEESPQVRAAIVVNLIASRAIVGSDADAHVEALLDHGTPATRVALADAIGQRGASGFEAVLARLAASEDVDVCAAAARAMASVGGPAAASALLALLANEKLQAIVRDQLAALGEHAFSAIERALEDPATPVEVRRGLPKALTLLEPARAATLVLAHLPQERDGLVRYRMIRTLEVLVKRDPTVRLSQRSLTIGIERMVSRAYRYVDRRLCLERGAADVPARDTDGHRLLRAMLRDKSDHAVDRAFRLLGLMHRNEDFAGIYRGLTSDERVLRASAIELLENLLPNPLRAAAVGLVDDLPDAERLAPGAAFHRPLALDYEALLAHMLESSSQALRDATVYHIGELRLRSFRPSIASLETSSDVEYALALLGTDTMGAQIHAD